MHKILFILIVFCCHLYFCYAEIDLQRIAKIESNNNPLAYNHKSRARGMYQITLVCLADYNNKNHTNYKDKDLYDVKINRDIANWYLTERITEFLCNSKIPIIDDYILICYNWGFGNFRKWFRAGADVEKLPKETRNYLKKYRR